jgi:hypothetical protein
MRVTIGGTAQQRRALRPLVVVIAVAASLLGPVAVVSAQPLPPDNADWLLTEQQATAATGSPVALGVDLIQVTPTLWSQTFVPTGGSKAVAGVTLLRYTEDDPLTRAKFARLSRGSHFGPDPSNDYVCVRVRETVTTRGRWKATRVCQSASEVVAVASVTIGHWILGGWASVPRPAGGQGAVASRAEAIRDARNLRGGQRITLRTHLRAAR